MHMVSIIINHLRVFMCKSVLQMAYRLDGSGQTNRKCHTQLVAVSFTNNSLAMAHGPQNSTS